MLSCAISADYVYKGGGQQGKHSAIAKVDNVAAISYAVVQIYHQMHHLLFTPITTATQDFGTNHYQILLSKFILCRLSGTVKEKKDSKIEIHAEDLDLYNGLARQHKTLVEAMKIFAKRQQVVADED